MTCGAVNKSHHKRHRQPPMKTRNGGAPVTCRVKSRYSGVTAGPRRRQMPGNDSENTFPHQTNTHTTTEELPEVVFSIVSAVVLGPLLSSKMWPHFKIR
jgi:hypothetical protein